MIRRGAPLARRFLPNLLSSGSQDVAVLAGSLNLSDFSGEDQHRQPSAASLGSVRSFSLFPSRGAAPPAAAVTDDGGFHAPSSDFTPPPSTGELAAAGTTAGAGDAATALDPTSILDLSQIGEAAALATAYEGAWAPTRGLLWVLESVHESTGLPWWGTVALATVGMRACTFPLMLMQIKNTHKLSAARPEIERLLEHMKEEQARGNTNATAEYQQRVMGVWQKYNANPMKSMGTLFVQAPLFIGFFSALRALATAKVPSFVDGGALWFHDLTLADPTYALPVLASATFLLTVELGAADGMEGQPDKMKSRLKNIMRGVAILVLPFTLSMPAGMFMYWITSNIFSLFQMSLLKVPGVKLALGVPTGKPGAVATAGAGAAGPTIGKTVPTYSQKPKKLL